MQTRHDPMPCGVSAQLILPGQSSHLLRHGTMRTGLHLTNNVSADLLEWTRTPGVAEVIGMLKHHVLELAS